MFSETRYALNGDLRVAYRASREGPRDIVFVPNWFTCCEVLPELPSLQGWVEAMTSLGRLIFFDQPGTGASDPVTPGRCRPWSNGPTASPRCSTISGVAKRFSSRRTPRSRQRRCSRRHIRLAPPRWSCSTVTQMRAAPHSFKTKPKLRSVRMWGSGKIQHLVNPDMPWNEEIRATWARMERLAASPRTASSRDASRDGTGRAGGPSDNPRADSRRPARRRRDHPAREGKYIAEHIPDAKYVELPGRNWYHLVEPGWRASFQEIAEFLTGHQAEVADDRVLATVLFTDIVDSTRRAAEIGDRDWHALLDAHDAVVRSQLARFRGREVNTSGDGFLAMFDGPQRAIRCAMAIRDAVQALGIEVRAGLHTGECEVRGDDIGGIAVHIGARVSALAGPNDVLVSSTLRDLVIGSGLEFDDRGAHELKGVPGEWHLFAVAST